MMGDPVGAEREACAGNSQGKQAEVRRDFGAVGADVRAVPNSRAAFPAISAGVPDHILSERLWMRRGFAMRVRPHTGRQLAAARVLAGITQEQLAERAGLHVNSIRYMERQRRITTGFSSERVAEALADVGVLFFTLPTCGIRLKPLGEEFRD